MTVTEITSNGHGSTGDRARQFWRPGMTGAELAEKLGVPERTGSYHARKLRAETGSSNDVARSRTSVSATPEPATPTRPQPIARRRPATARRRSATAPTLLVAATGVAVAVVVAVAAVVSYSHIRHLAVAAGMGSLAGWLPLALDGLVVACSCSMIVDRQHERRSSPLAVGGLAIGLAASLAANVLAVDPSLASERAVAVVLAGYTPIALAVSGHLLLRMLGDR